MRKQSSPLYTGIKGACKENRTKVRPRRHLLAYRRQLLPSYAHRHAHSWRTCLGVGDPRRCLPYDCDMEGTADVHYLIVRKSSILTQVSQTVDTVI